MRRPGPRLRRLVLWSAIGLGVAGVIGQSFRPQPVPVDLAEVVERPLVVTVDEEGQTRVRDTYTVSAPVMGRVRRTPLEAGDAVVAGETVVAEIEPSDPELLNKRTRAEAAADLAAAEADYSLATAQLEQALAELDFAESEFARSRRLAATDTISARDVDEAERAFRTRSAAVGTARAALLVREQAIARARARLGSSARTAGAECECVVETAPVSGQVLRILQKSESVVESGTPLVQIGDPGDLEIVVDMLSTEAVRVQAGQRAIIDGWGGTAALAGEVTRVEPYGFTKISALGVEEQRVNVLVDITSERSAWRALGHAFRVDVRVVVWETDAALTVPLTALFKSGSGWAVFVSEDDRARRRTVEIGHRAGLSTEVRAGLAPGEQVIVSPSDRVADGVAVIARTQPR